MKKVVKYLILIQFLIVLYAMIMSIITPIDKLVTIPLMLFYLLMAMSLMGLIYVSMSMSKECDKFIKMGDDKEK